MPIKLKPTYKHQWYYNKQTKSSLKALKGLSPVASRLNKERETEAEKDDVFIAA